MAKLEITVGSIVGSSPDYNDALAQETLDYYYSTHSERTDFPGTGAINQVKADYIARRITMTIQQLARSAHSKGVFEQAEIDIFVNRPGFE